MDPLERHKWMIILERIVAMGLDPIPLEGVCRDFNDIVSDRRFYLSALANVYPGVHRYMLPSTRVHAKYLYLGLWLVKKHKREIRRKMISNVNIIGSLDDMIRTSQLLKDESLEKVLDVVSTDSDMSALSDMTIIFEVRYVGNRDDFQMRIEGNIIVRGEERNFHIVVARAGGNHSFHFEIKDTECDETHLDLLINNMCRDVDLTIIPSDESGLYVLFPKGNIRMRDKMLEWLQRVAETCSRSNKVYTDLIVRTCEKTIGRYRREISMRETEKRKHLEPVYGRKKTRL